MAYIVTKNIIDTKDNDRLYLVGETYPRADFDVSENRIKGLLGKGVIVSDGAEGDVSLDDKKEPDLSKDELKAKLDELGIKYKSSDSKAELKALLDQVTVEE